MTTFTFEPTDCTGLAAIAALSVSVEQAARLIKTRYGITSCDADQPYATFEALRAAYDASIETGRPLPIYDGNMDDTIYADDETEIAYRFWTAIEMAELGFDFSIGSRMVAAERQLAVLERAGFTPGCEVHTLFQADTIGRLVGEIGTDNQMLYVPSLLFRQAVAANLSNVARAALERSS